MSVTPDENRSSILFQCDFCEDWQLDLAPGVHDEGQVEYVLREHVYDCVGIPEELRFRE